MNQVENQQARQYLLGTASEASAEEIELRLLTDTDYADEFNILVDRITDEYVKGAFHGQELKQVEEVFFKSAERREKLEFALALKRVEAERRNQTSEVLVFTKKPRPSSLKVYLPIAAGVLLMFGLGIVLWTLLRQGSQTNEGLIALNAAFNNHRPTESRISALDYAPFMTTRGSGDEVNKEELRRAELSLLNAQRNQPSPSVDHALGQVYLAKQQFDEAIREFDEALKADSGNAVLYSDLGAAWLEKGKVNRAGDEPGKGFEAFARSLENLDRALELNPNLPEALFNRAIVHQYLTLLDDAEADWQQYLNKDSSSGWANEARENLKALQKQKSQPRGSSKDFKTDFLAAADQRDAARGWELIRRNRDSVAQGKFLKDELLDQYLQLSGTGEKEQSQKVLEALLFLSQVEFDNTQDVYTSELTRFYSQTSSQQREALTKARQWMRLAQSYHSQSKPLEALGIFKEARQLFAGNGNSWEASVAELWIGYCHNNAKNAEESISILARLTSEFERRNYKWLHMRALHLLSGAQYNFSEYSRAIDYNLRSLAIAEQINDTRSAFNILSILVEQYRYIGNYEQSLHCVQRGLSLVQACDLSPEQLGQYFSIIASALSSAQLFRAAARYQQVALQTISKTAQMQTLSRTYANLGIIYGKLGKVEQAIQHATRGYETAKSLSDERVRKAMMAYSAQRIGDLYRQEGNVVEAIRRYEECLEIHKTSDNYYGLYEAHKSLFLSHLANRDDSAASAELKKTLGLIEEYRAQIVEEENRKHFFGTEQNIYDLAIDFEYSRKNNHEEAFNYSEASRSRSLLDLSKSKSSISTSNHANKQADIVFHSISQPLNLKEVTEQMPPETQIVQYAVLNDKLLIWLISKAGTHHFDKPISQDELQKRVTDFLRLISKASSSNEATATAANELYEYLIRPVESLLDKNRIIYFVPDKALHYLPFNALVSPDSGRFLVQEYVTAIAPSSTLFVNSCNIARARARVNGERILSVGNPRFSSSEFPDLADLPASKREAEEVGKFYDSRSVLIEKQATTSRILAEMGKADVVHLAVHSVLNPRLPLHSKLVLAEQTKGINEAATNDVLEARDIYGMNLAHTRLMVLSSCESGIGKYYGGEGMMSLARPFLAANVPLVVVSLWPVDSEATAELMINFHKHRKRSNVSTIQALRKAQLDLLNSSSLRSSRVYSWASFVTVGGWANF